MTDTLAAMDTPIAAPAKPQATAPEKPKSDVPALVVYALRFKQKRTDVNLYITTLRLNDLLGRFQTDTCEDESFAHADEHRIRFGDVPPIVFSEVMRTPPSTGSTDLIFCRSRMREPAGTWPVKRTRLEP